MLEHALLALAVAAWAEPEPAAAAVPAAEVRQESPAPELEDEGDEEEAPAALSEREERRLERQERRRLRREARRARRAARRQAEGQAAAGVEASGGASVAKAMRMGEALKKSLAGGASLEDALSGTEDPGGPASGGASVRAQEASAGAASAAKRLADPRNPRTHEDLLVAARSGYQDSFKELGLKVGQDEAGKPLIVGSDGKPASEPQLKSLSEHIAAQPGALVKRPDFFQVLPKPRYQELKKDFREQPELGEGIFKHVSLEDERDFVWSRSCMRLSGGCNEYAGSSSYQRGQDVAPEDLRAFWSARHSEPEPDKPAAPVALVDPASVRGRLKGVLSAIRSAFDGNSHKGGTGASVAGAPAVSGAGWDFQPGQTAELTEAPDKRRSRVGEAGRIQAASVVQAIPENARLPALGAGLAAMLGLLLLVRRRA